MAKDPIKLSELFVLRILEQIGPETFEGALRDAVRAHFVVDHDVTPFTLGAHRSFRDFLVELEAAGSVRLEPSDGEAHVKLTPHGRKQLDRAVAQGFADYRFG